MDLTLNSTVLKHLLKIDGKNFPHKDILLGRHQFVIWYSWIFSFKDGNILAIWVLENFNLWSGQVDMISWENTYQTSELEVNL